MSAPEPVWKDGDPPILVFAGNYSQAEYWARHVANLTTRRAFRYLRNVQDLRGYRGNKAIMVGSFYHRNGCEISDMLEYAKVMNLTWLPDYDVR